MAKGIMGSGEGFDAPSVGRLGGRGLWRSQPKPHRPAQQDAAGMRTFLLTVELRRVFSFCSQPAYLICKCQRISAPVQSCVQVSQNMSFCHTCMSFILCNRIYIYTSVTP